MSFTKPSDAPAGDGWKFTVEENIGSLFVIEPIEEREVNTEWGEKTVIAATITEIDLDEPTKDSETHDDVLIFAAWIQGDVRGLIKEGGMMLGRLAQDPDKGQGRNAAWVMEDPDDEDIEAATAWLNARSKKALGTDKKKSKKK